MAEDQRTDPARELAALHDKIRGFHVHDPNVAQPPPSWQVLSKGLNVDVGSADFLEVLAIVRARLTRLDTFVAGLSDANVGADVKQHVHEAIGRFSEMFNASHLSHHWKQVEHSWLVASDATTLRMFSPVMVQQQPLRLLTAAEREEALAAVAHALADIGKAGDLDPWQRAALKQGYEKLQLVLRHFEFFGHDGLTQEVVIVTNVTRAIEKRLPSKSTTLKNAFAALSFLARIVEIFAAPDLGVHAGLTYYQWAHLDAPPAAETLRLAGPEQPLIQVAPDTPPPPPALPAPPDLKNV